jgi:hypothetical protein
MRLLDPVGHVCTCPGFADLYETAPERLVVVDVRRNTFPLVAVLDNTLHMGHPLEPSRDLGRTARTAAP